MQWVVVSQTGPAQRRGWSCWACPAFLAGATVVRLLAVIAHRPAPTPHGAGRARAGWSPMMRRSGRDLPPWRMVHGQPVDAGDDGAGHDGAGAATTAHGDGARGARRGSWCGVRRRCRRGTARGRVARPPVRRRVVVDAVVVVGRAATPRADARRGPLAGSATGCSTSRPGRGCWRGGGGRRARTPATSG